MRFPLAIELRPSRLALVLNAAIHAIAAFAFLFSSLHPLVVIVVVILVAASALQAMRDELRKGGCRLVLEDNGELCVENAGRALLAVPERSCVDFGWAVWLHWRGVPRSGSRQRTITGAMMLLPDNLDAHEWRGLCIWLRHKASGVLDSSEREGGNGRPTR